MSKPSERPKLRTQARVALVANNFAPVRGGSAIVYANLARGAAERIVVVAPRISYTNGLPMIGWREHDRRQPYRVVRLQLLRTRIDTPTRHWGQRLMFMAHDIAIRMRLAAVLTWLVASQHVRTICVGELLASAWIIHLCRFIPGLRVVAYVHGEEITTTNPYDPANKRGERALHESDCIIVVSRFTKAEVERRLGARPRPRVLLVENGVDASRFRPAPRAPDLVEQYHLRGCFVFVSVCRLLEKKGIDNAIRAFASMVQLHAGCRFLVVGSGEYEPVLRALVAELRLTSQVLFAGAVAEDELADHYRLGDVFVMPNRQLPNGDTEGFGLVFLEANGCGLPVIAGRDGGSTDAVQDGVNGLVVDGASVPAIAEAMRRLHDDADLRARLTRQGLALAARAGWAEKTRAFLSICLDRAAGAA